MNAAHNDLAQTSRSLRELADALLVRGLVAKEDAP